MNIRKLQQGLKYRGRVEAVRQTYHVFEASDYFFVLSFSLSKSRRGSGYFNVVDRAAVDYVQHHVGGSNSVTAAHQARSNQPDGAEYPLCAGRPGRGAHHALRRASAAVLRRQKSAPAAISQPLRRKAPGAGSSGQTDDIAVIVDIDPGR